MPIFNINHQDSSKNLPSFSITMDGNNPIAIYSSAHMQNNLAWVLKKDHQILIHDREDGLYERLTIGDNIAFYHKWYNCKTPLSEIIVLFNLQNCTKKVLRKSSVSEVRRVYFAKQYLNTTNPMVFLEPIHGVNVLTIDTFMNMVRRLTEQQIPVLILTTNLEHSLLLSDTMYKLKESGLQKIDTKAEEVSGNSEEISPSVTNLFKISAKVDDKVILFDPLEIDYIESQDGKSQIVINDESFAMDATLAEVEKKLEVYGFFRCHRSYIVNLQKVREIITWSKNTYSLKIDNQMESTIPLSRSKIQAIQTIFNLK